MSFSDLEATQAPNSHKPVVAENLQQPRLPPA
jgi:hypothetical protein